VIASVSFGPSDRVAVTTNDCPNYPERLSISDKLALVVNDWARLGSQEYEPLGPRVRIKFGSAVPGDNLEGMMRAALHHLLFAVIKAKSPTKAAHCGGARPDPRELFRQC
jgi:hypothetical protein